MYLGGGIAGLNMWLIVREFSFPNFLVVYCVSLLSSHAAGVATSLVFVEELAIVLNCGLAAIFGVAGLRRHRGLHLHIHSRLPARSLYSAAAIASLVVATLPLAQLLTGNPETARGMAMWVIYSCLLLTGFLFLFSRSQRSGLIGATFSGCLCILASAELIVRTVNWSDTPLVISVPLIFWLCGLVQLELLCDRSLPLGLCDSIAARRGLRRLLPLMFVVSVAIVVLAATVERLGYCDRGSGEAIAASIFCVVMAGIVAFVADLLYQIEQGFWKLFEDGDEAMLMVDPTTHHIQSGNAKAAQLFGGCVRHSGTCLLEDLFRMTPGEQLRNLGRPHAEGSIRKAVKVPWTNLNGREIWLELSGTLVPFRGTDMLMVHARDVSALRNLQLAQSQTEKMRALSQLAGGVAHDFGNLFHGMHMCSNLLAEQLAEGSESQELLKHIDSSIDSALRITDWLLAYCQQHQVSYQNTDLNRVVISVADLMRRTLRSSVSVRTNLDERLGQVRVDPVQMEEMLINLAINARDSMPDGGTLRFETQSMKLSAADCHKPIPPGLYVLLSVIDTGVGMNEETASLAFEPFFTTKKRDCGTGLGLVVVDGIVRESGGFIRLESSVGKGTKVEIFLPLCDENGGSGIASSADAVA
jgi:signal transduction histidine kinase